MSPTLRYTIRIAACLIILLAVGYWAERHLARADAWCYTSAGRLFGGWKAGEYAQLHRPGQPIEQEPVVLRRMKRHCPPVHYVVWSEAARGEAQPLPKRQELATILHCLATKLGVQSVAVSCPLMWEDEQGEMAGHMLQRAFEGFRHVGLGFAGRSAPQAQATPELLLPAVIPAAQVSGDAAGLPSANTPQPYSLLAPLAATLLPAPDQVEDEKLIRDAVATRGLSLPLLLRWNGEVLASLPLRLALAELGLSPADVHVRLGKTLRVGGRVLPLDAYGRTPLGAARAVPLPLEDVLTAYMPLPEEAQRCAALCRAAEPQAAEPRAACLAATLSQLLSREEESLIPAERPAGGHLMEQSLMQTSLTGRLACIALALALLVLPPLMPRAARLAVVIALPVLAVAAACYAAQGGVWLSICACLVCAGLLPLLHLFLSPPRTAQQPTLW